MRASPCARPEKTSRVLYTNTKGSRKREGARAHATFPERERIKRVRTMRVILKNIFRVRSMGA